MKIGLFETASMPALMGIVNVTPDSFSDGGLFLECEKAIAHALSLVEGGADLLDIGGESARPGSQPVLLEEELKRVIPVIKGIRRHCQIPISIDTTKYEVAAAAIDAGACMINDISAGTFDPRILSLSAESASALCLMHMQGTPLDMQIAPAYDDVISEIAEFLNQSAGRAIERGVLPEQIILDPGICFGKSPADNLEILRNLHKFTELGFPLMVGTSRKSFIGKLLDLNVNERLEATLATIPACLNAKISILRLHDIAKAKRFIDMFRLLDLGLVS